MKKREFLLNNEPERAGAISFLRLAPLARGIKVTIETSKTKRSLNQNSLMWKWLTEAADELAEESGHTPEEIHEFFKSKFLSGKIIEVNGETIQYRTTTKLDITEMTAYLNHIYLFCTEMGIMLTIPPVQDQAGREIGPMDVG